MRSAPQLVVPFEQTISGVAARLRARELTCVAVLESCFARIDSWEPDLHAWVSVDRAGALSRARELDADLNRGIDRGPLHGIPLGIKDLVDVAGYPTGAGSRRLSLEPVQDDAPLVTRLREAGAVILGKTVTTQFACFDPPATRNPWNLERTPGGSSSGSAAAVATGMCLAAIGSQTGGSITRPASFCGVSGCKPSFGRIPVTGVFPVAHSLDHPGPIARTVGDLSILLEALVPGLRLPTASPPSPPRLGLPGGLFETRVSAAMSEKMATTCRLLQEAGARIDAVPLPAAFEEILARHRTIMVFELGEVHRERFARYPEDYLPGITGLIEESRSISRDDYDRALGHQARLKQSIGASFGTSDVLVCPATTGPAPDPSTTGDPSFNSPWSYLGLPTVSIPIGLSPDGLPLAMQFVGKFGEEVELFRASAWCESIVQARLRAEVASAT
jgi:Asp-tRNA(Asn)/Glu-tRNA(Gln) amidotransferase A subunit family amidase